MRNYRIHFLSVIVISTLLSLVFLPAPALLAQKNTGTATPLEDWSRWVLKMDFSDDEINGIWTVSVGYHDPISHEPVITQQHQEKIDCTPHGQFQIVNEVAQFNGIDGYLECNLPSYENALLALAPHLVVELGEAGNCECVNPHPYASANVQIIQSSNKRHPILFHPDFYWGVREAGWGRVVPELIVSNISFISPNTPPMELASAPDRNQLFAGFVDSFFWLFNHPDQEWDLNAIDLLRFVDEATATPSTEILQWINGNPGQRYLPPPDAKIKITTQPTTFYIGYNPITNQFANMELAQLAVDPACKSN